MHRRVFGLICSLVVLSVVGATPADVANDPDAGVRAQYFRWCMSSGPPPFQQVEERIDYHWGEGEGVGGFADWVSVLWTANVVAPHTGTYRLITTSDGGVRLWLNGRLIIDHLENVELADDSAEVQLTAGRPYLLEMKWCRQTAGTIAQLSWQSDRVERQIIPPGVLRLPTRAAKPYPADGVTDAGNTCLLRWNAGESAIRHDLYLGEDANAVAAATPVDAAIYKGSLPCDELGVEMFDPGVLKWNTTYYWRVDEINEANPASPWKGSVWGFTTADFIVLDDFESYTDDVYERIFYTWIDCFGCSYSPPAEPGPVSCYLIVGYHDPPYCEQQIVHTGMQSMPLDYNNVPEPYYGETQRTWLTAQNWTVNGMDTLTLFFRAGRVSVQSPNPQPLYVAVHDTAGRIAVVNHPDPSAVTAADWQEWRIPLADFAAAGVNVTKVKRMYIGIGDRKDPKPGGAGILFIDDIRVIKAAGK